jgi:hypothetical protein
VCNELSVSVLHIRVAVEIEQGLGGNR